MLGHQLGSGQVTGTTDSESAAGQALRVDYLESCLYEGQGYTFSHVSEEELEGTAREDGHLSPDVNFFRWSYP
jgi:hypothetical protein